MNSVRRIRRSRSVPAGGKLDRLDEVLKSIATLDADAARRDAERKELAEEAEALMVSLKLTTREVDTAIAEMVRSAGKATNTIDPKKFMNAVEEKDFFAAISVSVTKAKELLPGKTLERMTTTVAGKAGDPKLKVTLKSK